MLLVNKQCGIETLQPRKSETVVDQRRVRKFVTTVEHLLEVLTATALFLPPGHSLLPGSASCHRVAVGGERLLQIFRQIWTDARFYCKYKAHSRESETVDVLYGYLCCVYALPRCDKRLWPELGLHYTVLQKV